MIDFKKAEDEVLRFWEENKIYSKVKEKNKDGKKFYFMDGPPYATGYIHMGTALNKILKDVAIRLKMLQGYDVFDRPGYDTHGLPIEFQVEKEIGSKSKKDIEKYGVKKFVERCKEFATKYIDVMNGEFKDLGVWMDWDNPYLTLDNEYIEAVWDVLKKANEKQLLYLGKYPVHLCPRCETAVAYNEIEYGKIEDTSVYVKFPIVGEENKFLIIWTTTPWTLPGNTGIMVHPDLVYQELDVDNEIWVMAKDRVEEVMSFADKNYTVIKEFKGEELKDIRYENPLFENLNLKIKNGKRVVLSGRYVSVDEGTGLVHCAPGHGKEDYEVGKENDLDSPCPVGMDGVLTDEAGKYSGKRAREVDKEIIEDLYKGGFLVYKRKFKHDYPLCWRCKTPLLMVSQPQWFLKISEIHKKLLDENNEVNWVPDYMKSRMKAWLEGIGDWPISRERYWGTPLPIWIDKDGETIVVGSVKELRELSGVDVSELHKPEIDEIVLEKEGKKYRRISAVLDVWIDSGVTSWAALGYPSNKEKFERFWPADLNIEGKDQFRGWWNSQLILSLIGFDKKPYENIAVHGMVLDVEKKKMSKSLGNIVSPKEVIKKFSRDYLRYYFAKLSRGEDFAYDEREFKEIANVFRVLLNVNNFVNQINQGDKKEKIEDKWIISRLNSTKKEVTDSFNDYRFYEGIYKLEKFLVEDVSRTYIQMIRERSEEVKDIIEQIRDGVVKMYSPIIPFITEKIWQSMNKEKSIFLSSWPSFEKDKINMDLEEDFSVVLKIIEAGLRERDRERIGLRWPLQRAIVGCGLQLNDEMKDIIARQLNIKEVELREEKEIKVELDTKMTDELEAEGFAREIARKVQAERKNAGLNKNDLISLSLGVSKNLREKLENFKEFIKERTGSEKVDFTDDKEGDKFEIKDESVVIKFR